MPQEQFLAPDKPKDQGQYLAPDQAATPQARSTANAPAPNPGWLDREIPLTSHTNATLSGVQSIGRGFRNLGVGMGNFFDPHIKEGENELTAMPAARFLRGVGDLGKQATQLPGAIRDINASGDPLYHYATAAQNMAGEGAAQALTAAATEGAIKSGPYIKPVGEALGKAAVRKFIPAEVRTAVKAVQDARPPAPVAPPPRVIPGVDVPPSVDRLSEPTSAAQRASEPPAPAKPGHFAAQQRPSVERIAEPARAIPGVDVRPSVERIAEAPAPASAKAVEPPPLATKRAAEVSAPSDVKPVVPSDEAVARMDRARNYRLGTHAGNPEADAYLTKTNQELVDEANARKIDGRTDWNVKDLKRTGSVHGKFLAPAKEDLIGKLLQPDRTGADTSADISRAISNDKSLADIGKHEANMRQRAAESQTAREKLGPLGLESQKPTLTPPPAKGVKAGRYYDRYGKQ